MPKANALLVLYDPGDELLSFDGSKLWFTIEPFWHPHFHSHPVGKRLVRELDASERAFYAHLDATYRVPHPTYSGRLSQPRAGVAETDFMKMDIEGHKLAALRGLERLLSGRRVRSL